MFCFVALLDDVSMDEMNAADDDDYDDDDDGRSSPAETLPYTPLSPSEDDDDDGKKTADCLINAAYNCYTQMHKPVSYTHLTLPTNREV